VQPSALIRHKQTTSVIVWKPRIPKPANASFRGVALHSLVEAASHRSQDPSSAIHGTDAALITRLPVRQWSHSQVRSAMLVPHAPVEVITWLVAPEAHVCGYAIMKQEPAMLDCSHLKASNWINFIASWPKGNEQARTGRLFADDLWNQDLLGTKECKELRSGLKAFQ